MTLNLLKNCIFSVKMSRLCHPLRNVIMDIITLRYEICKPFVVYRFYCMAFYHSQMQCHVINPLSISVDPDQLASDENNKRHANANTNADTHEIHTQNHMPPFHMMGDITNNS